MSQSALALWSDNEASIDLLRFDYLADTIADVATTASVLPVTIGVFGDWGSGKSTLMRLAQQRLDQRERVLTLSFNGWLFEGYEEAKAALLGSILDAIKGHSGDPGSWSERLKERFARLTARVDWLRLAYLFAGAALPYATTGDPRAAAVGAIAAGLTKAREAASVGALPDFQEVQQYLKEAPDGAGVSQDGGTVRRTLSALRDEFSGLLQEAGIAQLVVFIDDLDRCLPDTVIETLEAIKLFLFVPGTAFVLGADEWLIQYAVRRRFPELPDPNAEVGRNYLEKLIQVPIRIPPLSRPDIESYFNLLLVERRLAPERHGQLCAAVAERPLAEFGALAFDAVIAEELLTTQITSEQLFEVLDLIREDCLFTSALVPVLMPGLAGNPRRAKRFLNSLILRLRLAERRGLALQRSVLAKLMLLEYVRPIFFKTLAEWQAAEQGRPAALFLAEQRTRALGTPPAVSPEHSEGVDAGKESAERQPVAAKIEGTAAKGLDQASALDQAPPPPAAQVAVPEEIKSWLDDPWAKGWLTLDPSLAAEDLRPYFYIAHDQLQSSPSAHAQLSQHANRVLANLLDLGPVTQRLGLDAAATLSEPDASAIFQVLIDRLRQSERVDGNSVQPILFRYVGARAELLPQLVQVLTRLPEGKLGLAVPSQLVSAVRGQAQAETIRTLLLRWSQSASGNLGQAAAAALQHLDHPTQQL